jgi:protease II
MATEPKPKPPVAKKVEHVMEMFGDVRIDNYYWLRDDSRTDPELLSYLKQENAYTDSVMSGKKEPVFVCLSVRFSEKKNKTSSFFYKVAKSLKMSCLRR